MPTPTYTPLATVTLGTSAASVTFSSIPATYRDLILIFDGTGSGSTGKAAVLDNFNFLGIEMSEEYVALAEARIKAVLAEDES